MVLGRRSGTGVRWPTAGSQDVDLDLFAAVPGHYEAPATSAYLYYTAEDKAWTAPVQVTVDR